MVKLEIKPEDEVQYYSYFMCYVDDIPCIHHNVDAMQEWLHKPFPFKLGFSKLYMYLMAKLHKTRLHNGVWTWAMSPVKYV